MLLDIDIPEMPSIKDSISGFNNSPEKMSAGLRPQDPFAHAKRKAWNADSADLARCDFAPGRAQMILRGSFRSISLWRRSIKGMSLAEIKETPDMIPFFIAQMAEFIQTVIGEDLKPEHFCIVAPPKRRHKIKNFAATVAQGIANELGIPFHDDFALCRTRQRVGAEFTAAFTPPEHNVIVFDDFVTSGSTLTSMKNLLDSLGKNSIFFTAILNKK
ncbi:MAG: phosphoribosyltransferase [Bacteroides sp.]|nr:phosphoribosyltransferase [Bacteroides sp.]